MSQSNDEVDNLAISMAEIFSKTHLLPLLTHWSALPSKNSSSSSIYPVEYWISGCSIIQWKNTNISVFYAEEDCEPFYQKVCSYERFRGGLCVEGLKFHLIRNTPGSPAVAYLYSCGDLFSNRLPYSATIFGAAFRAPHNNEIPHRAEERCLDEIVARFSNPGDLVIDPFSGTIAT